MNTGQIIFSNHREERPASGLSKSISALISRYQEILEAERPKADIATIHVDEIASKIASLYEKVRKIIDWKEEHLIRRGAIERILKRRFISELSGISLIPNSKPEEFAEPLVLELIRGCHFANDKIPRKKISQVEKALKKYVYILESAFPANGPSSKDVKKKVNFYNWILEICACEIEEILDPARKQNALINFMTKSMEERIKPVSAIKISEDDKRIQIYIAVHHALFHLDSPIISFRLIKLRYPQWQDPSKTELEQLAENIFAIWEKIEKDLSHPLASDFHKICEKYDTVYLIISDILEFLSKNPEEMEKKFSNSKNLESLIEKTYQKRLSTLKKRLFRAAVYSTLSIFVAGGLSLFIVEVPLAKLVYGRFSPLAIVVDILIPTLVMFFLVAIIRLPKETNFRKVVEEAKKLVYSQEETDVYEIRPAKKKGFLAKLIIGFIYSMVSIISLGLTFYIFYIVRIPITSLIIDTFNVAMVVFAGLIIRQRAKEMTIEEKTTFWEFWLDLLSVPLGKLGQWLSKKWREYNIVSVFFTALVDMPFSGLIEFIEAFNFFIKEKKAEIQQ